MPQMIVKVGSQNLGDVRFSTIWHGTFEVLVSAMVGWRSPAESYLEQDVSNEEECQPSQVLVSGCDRSQMPV